MEPSSDPSPRRSRWSVPVDANVGARGFWDSLKSELRRVRLLALQVGEVAPRQAFHGDTLATDSGPSKTDPQAEEFICSSASCASLVTK